MQLLIVIVNYRTAGLTIDCLQSLESELAAIGDSKAVVVDNSSGDGSVERLTIATEQENWTSWVTLLSLNRNGGFSSGNNAAIRQALAAESPPQYVLLLNPDTLVKPGMLREMIAFLDAHPKVGIVGARMEDAAGQVQPSARRIPSPLSELDSGARLGVISRTLQQFQVCMPVQDQPHACEWVCAAAMMVRREVFESAGLMDEGYFLYFEDPDFCWRAGRAGWEVWYLPSAQVIHLEGKATQVNVARKRRPAYWFESRRRFFLKSHGIAGLLTADVLWSIGRCGLTLRRMLGLARSSEQDPKWFTWDLLWGDAKSLLTGQLFRTQREVISR